MARIQYEILKTMGGWSDLKMPMRYAHVDVSKLAKYTKNAAR
jgi:hypothetical protein